MDDTGSQASCSGIDEPLVKLSRDQKHRRKRQRKSEVLKKRAVQRRKRVLDRVREELLPFKGDIPFSSDDEYDPRVHKPADRGFLDMKAQAMRQLKANVKVEKRELLSFLPRPSEALPDLSDGSAMEAGLTETKLTIHQRRLLATKYSLDYLSLQGKRQAVPYWQRQRGRLLMYDRFLRPPKDHCFPELYRVPRAMLSRTYRGVLLVNHQLKEMNKNRKSNSVLKDWPGKQSEQNDSLPFSDADLEFWATTSDSDVQAVDPTSRRAASRGPPKPRQASRQDHDKKTTNAFLVEQALAELESESELSESESTSSDIENAGDGTVGTLGKIGDGSREADFIEHEEEGEPDKLLGDPASMTAKGREAAIAMNKTPIVEGGDRLAHEGKALRGNLGRTEEGDILVRKGKLCPTAKEKEKAANLCHGDNGRHQKGSSRNGLGAQEKGRRKQKLDGPSNEGGGDNSCEHEEEDVQDDLFRNLLSTISKDPESVFKIKNAGARQENGEVTEERKAAATVENKAFTRKRKRSQFAQEKEKTALFYQGGLRKRQRTTKEREPPRQQTERQKQHSNYKSSKTSLQTAEKMMTKMGFTGALGAKGQGIAEPIAVSRNVGRAGIGVARTTVQFGGDPLRLKPKPQEETHTPTGSVRSVGDALRRPSKPREGEHTPAANFERTSTALKAGQASAECIEKLSTREFADCSRATPDEVSRLKDSDKILECTGSEANAGAMDNPGDPTSSAVASEDKKSNPLDEDDPYETGYTDPRIDNRRRAVLLNCDVLIENHTKRWRAAFKKVIARSACLRSDFDFDEFMSHEEKGLCDRDYIMRIMEKCGVSTCTESLDAVQEELDAAFKAGEKPKCDMQMFANLKRYSKDVHFGLFHGGSHGRLVNDLSVSGLAGSFLTTWTVSVRKGDKYPYLHTWRELMCRVGVRASQAMLIFSAETKGVFPHGTIAGVVLGSRTVELLSDRDLGTMPAFKPGEHEDASRLVMNISGFASRFESLIGDLLTKESPVPKRKRVLALYSGDGLWYSGVEEFRKEGGGTEGDGIGKSLVSFHGLDKREWVDIEGVMPLARKSFRKLQDAGFPGSLEPDDLAFL